MELVADNLDLEVAVVEDDVTNHVLTMKMIVNLENVNKELINPVNPLNFGIYFKQTWINVQASR